MPPSGSAAKSETGLSYRKEAASMALLYEAGVPLFVLHTFDRFESIPFQHKFKRLKMNCTLIIIFIIIQANFKLTIRMFFDIKFRLCYGDVAQLGERGVRNAEARGSSPLISTKN